MANLPFPAVMYIANNFFNIPPYLDDEEDEILSALIYFEVWKHKHKKLQLQIPKIDNFVERIVPQFSTNEFKSHFRLQPDTFEYILSLIAEQLQKRGSGNDMITPDKQFLLTLWRMATPDSYRSIHQRFGVRKATAIRAVRRVTKALYSLSSKVIQWPAAERYDDIIKGFSNVGAFPQTIGAVDGTHIHIPAPKKNPEAYVNRKGYHSIQTQVVCDLTRLFIHVHVGSVGSVHDARVFRLSGLQNYVFRPSKISE